MHGTIHFAWSGFGAGDYSFSLLLFEKRLLKVGWEIPRICDALVWLCPVFFHGFPDKKSSASCNVGISPVYERVEGRLSGMPLSFRHVLSESILSSDMAFKRLFSNSPMGLKLTALYRNYVKKIKFMKKSRKMNKTSENLVLGVLILLRQN